jgi:hypothetical protein
MKTLPTLLLVTLIPLAAASSVNLGNGIGAGQPLPNTSGDGIGNPDVAVCRGTKCAGPRDTIRNGQDLNGAEQLVGNRGGKSTSGTKKGPRHHDGSQAMPALAGNRGGQTTSGTKKGPRHHDDRIVSPA